MRHTSGLVYGQLGDRLVHEAYREAKVTDPGQGLTEMVTKLAKLPLAHHPGAVWEYSMSSDVLGRVVEVVSEMELDRFISERMTRPLGIASTDFYVHEPDLGLLAQAQMEPDGKPVPRHRTVSPELNGRHTLCRCAPKAAPPTVVLKCSVADPCQSRSGAIADGNRWKTDFLAT
jgi:CubicO group peptidase (beta-lactamase class C family)